MSNKIINTVGVITLFASVIYLIKKINRQTETKLISDKAFNALQKKDNIDKLDSIISDYHKTGKWNKSELNSIE